jgi:hypothetical protein
MPGRRAPLLVVLLASLVFAAPASAFDPPEVFVRTAAPSGGQPGPWLPLASAPTFDWLGGYDVGYKAQASGEAYNRQRVALRITGVPDGRPTQPNNPAPYCSIRADTPAGGIDLVSAQPIQFESDGMYSVAVSIGPSANQTETDCLAGPTTTGSFAVTTAASPQVVGAPLASRNTPLPPNQFVGVRTPDPPGGFAQTQCALDATVEPDGSIAGRLLVPETLDAPETEVQERHFTEPGTWTCVARGAVEGVADDLDRVVFGTPWSAPLRFVVLSDFQRVRGALAGPRSKKPRFSFTAQFPAASAGGSGKLVVRQITRCQRHKYVFKKVASATAKFDSKGRAKFTIKHPRGDAYYVGTLSFGGTRLIRKSVDPQGVLLSNRSGMLAFVARIPAC